MVSGSGSAAIHLAQRLRELREHEWDDLTVRQAHLATALDASPATVSSYESLSAPKTPTTARLTAYAQFFATRRSMNGEGPTLYDPISFTPDERERFEQLKAELLDLHAAIGRDPVGDEPQRRQLLQFPGADRVVVVCPEAPLDSLGPLADEKSLNHTRLHRFADADALLEVFGHIRALNPDLKVFHRLPSEIQQSDLQSHIVLLGGIGWNPTTRRILSHLKAELPIEQIDDGTVPEGDVFRVTEGRRPRGAHLSPCIRRRREERQPRTRRRRGPDRPPAQPLQLRPHHDDLQRNLQ